jgi:GGDEF domain-containing protein
VETHAMSWSSFTSFTLVKKVIAGYLLIVLFSLVAIGYALTSLHRQTTLSEQLVAVEFKTITLLRTLRQTLLAQESLSKQYLILKDQTFDDLLNRRQLEFSEQWQQLETLLSEDNHGLRQLADSYRKEAAQCLILLTETRWQEAEVYAQKCDLLRGRLLAETFRLISLQDQGIDRQLSQLTTNSRQAYQITWLLAFLGILFSAPAVSALIFSINRSIRVLLQATREIAEGSFDYQVPISQNDEFGHLAREFVRMGQKIRETGERSLDANPLTRLPGNLVLDRELLARIDKDTLFSQIYFDLDHFKVYNDRYGYQAGSDVIAQVGELIQQGVDTTGNPDDVLGHIGGDDYVVLTSPNKADELAHTVLAAFDQVVPSFYSDEDVKAGHFKGKDRYGVERTFPLLTISIAIVDSENLDPPLGANIGRECARMKEHLKHLPGSNILRNRRHRLV